MGEGYRTMGAIPGYVTAKWGDGELINRDAAIKWGGVEPPPPIGTEITVNFNGLGPATVKGYFVEVGWLGLLVRLRKPPAWWAQQNPTRPLAHVFGPEFMVLP